jgi:hypothetical protein
MPQQFSLFSSIFACLALVIPFPESIASYHRSPIWPKRRLLFLDLIDALSTRRVDCLEWSPKSIRKVEATKPERVSEEYGQGVSSFWEGRSPRFYEKLKIIVSSPHEVTVIR